MTTRLLCVFPEVQTTAVALGGILSGLKHQHPSDIPCFCRPGSSMLILITGLACSILSTVHTFPGRNLKRAEITDVVGPHNYHVSFINAGRLASLLRFQARDTLACMAVHIYIYIWL